MQYAYTAKSSTGETTSGVLTADRPKKIEEQLRDQSLYAVSIKPTREGTSRATGGNIPRRRVPKRDLLGLTTQLAIMSRAGVDLAGALQSLSEQCRNPTLKTTLAEVHTDVTGGKSVSESLRKHARVFGDAYVASVAAGEASGQLPEILNRLAHLQRSEIRNRRTVRALMAYPLVLAAVSSLVVAGLIGFVLPQFALVFKQIEMPLPAITRVLISISFQLRTWLWLWAPLLIVGIVSLAAALRSGVGRRAWDRLALDAVLLREVTRSLLIGRAFRLLGIMIDSGVPLLEGLRLTRNSLKNVHYRELFDVLEEDVVNGRALLAAEFVPSMAAEMVVTAERTGTLGMVTQLMGEYFEEEGEARLRELATLIEPMIVVAMGIVVAMVVLAVMLPMFDMATFTQ